MTGTGSSEAGAGGPRFGPLFSPACYDSPMRARSLFRTLINRRVFLSCLTAVGLPLGCTERERFPSEISNYPDPATEFTVFRLTNPTHESRLASAGHRVTSRDGLFLFYSSDRTGTAEVYRMNLRTGESERLTSAQQLRRDTVALLPGENRLAYFDSEWLMLAELARRRARRVCPIAAGWSLEQGFAVSAGGREAAFVERRDDVFRLRLASLSSGSVATVVEANQTLAAPQFHPRHSLLLYRAGEDSLWVTDYRGASRRRLPLAAGGVGPAWWSRDGSAILYLNFPPERRSLNSIREFTLADSTDRLVAPTSQFVAFSPNANASVFVGASGSVASPYLLLLVRATRRELTLCEHRSTAPATVAPVFSPDSQLVFFHSDRHGKTAIYAMRVDRLVEKTES